MIASRRPSLFPTPYVLLPTLYNYSYSTVHEQQLRLRPLRSNAAPTIMAPNLDRILNLAAFTFCSIVLFCLILLTPTDAIYQCYKTQRLTNIFFITGAYVVTFLLAVLIYATRIYTNRSALTGIPKAWIPVEKEDVGTSVRRLVMDGLSRSAVIAYQARPRDLSDDVTDGGGREETFTNHQSLLVDRTKPPWGVIEHPGWSSPASSMDLPDLPYRTVIQELPHLIEAKAVSLAPPDSIFTATTSPAGADGGGGSKGYAAQQAIPDTRVVEILQRPAYMGVREYIQHLTSLDVVQPPEIGAEFVGLYERARFSSHELYEAEFRELMHVFAEVLRGMTSLGAQVLDEIRDGGSSRDDTTTTSSSSESVIGPSDEEGETDTVDYYHGESSPISLRPSPVSLSHDYYKYHEQSQQPQQRQHPYQTLITPRTPSTRSLHRMRSNVSGSSGGSVIRPGHM